MKKEIKKKLLKEYKVIWTDWEMLDNNKMRRVENKSVKRLLEMLIDKVYKIGFCEKAKQNY